MRTLQLFNGVLSKQTKNNQPYIDFENGLIIPPDAIWAKDKIITHYSNRLSGDQLNKTFHKSFAKVRNSSRYDLYIEQIRHYVSTYGTNFEGDVYIPDELLNVPELKLKFKTVQTFSKEQLIQKSLSMLNSGIAMNQDSIVSVLCLLSDELGYTFTGKEKIKNKEAVVLIADLYGVIPDDTIEFFRYIIYRATGDSLLIKNSQAINKIKDSSYNPSAQFRKHGLVKLASIFNRYKPLFLAFKNKCPKTINKISRLSKKHHKPMVQNPLNLVTNRLLTHDDIGWLDNATPYAIFKALQALQSRMKGQTSFTYRVRNGKSWTVNNKNPYNPRVWYPNSEFIIEHLRDKYDFSGKSVYIPKNIEYSLPTSEKMFIGSVPTGTKFYGKKLAVGMYWKNEWGARDLDLSAIDTSGNKIGWNGLYSGDTLTYSGDMTNASNGAVEYLHADKGLNNPYIIKMNVFSGSNDSKYKIIVGKGSNINRDYMMNPNNLKLEVMTECVQKQMVLGLLIPEGNKQSFTLLNFGAGQARVSADSNGLVALYEQYKHSTPLSALLAELGATVTRDKKESASCDVDLSIESLSKDSITGLFA